MANPLSPWQRFGWGFLGGLIIVVFRLLAYAHGLPEDVRWGLLLAPKHLLVAGCWCAFPFFSGWLSFACEAHHRFIALYEGASLPALFLVIAKGLVV
jgi:hypothetical protein